MLRTIPAAIGLMVVAFILLLVIPAGLQLLEAVTL